MVGVVGDHGEAGVVVHHPVLTHADTDINIKHVAILVATAATVGLKGVGHHLLIIRNAVSILTFFFKLYSFYFVIDFT